MVGESSVERNKRAHEQVEYADTSVAKKPKIEEDAAELIGDIK